MTSVLNPDCTFAALQEQLAQAGWRLVSQATSPLLVGEPEHALFERAAADGARRLVYTFNPVCRLHVLDCAAAGAAPELQSLPWTTSRAVREWLASSDERTVLRGILAAGQLADAALSEAVQAHRSHPRAALAQAAERVAQQLSRAPRGAPADAQTQALAIIEALKQQLRPVLEAMPHDRDGSLVAKLRPRADDVARAFMANAAGLAQKAVEDAWAHQTPRVRDMGTASRLQMHIAPAGMLGEDNMLSRAFPGGYRQLSPLLNPHRVWVCWKYLTPGQSSGMAYDGLVWLDDHWAWFPKPYRLLAPLLTPTRQATPGSPS